MRRNEKMEKEEKKNVLKVKDNLEGKEEMREQQRSQMKKG